MKQFYVNVYRDWKGGSAYYGRLHYRGDLDNICIGKQSSSMRKAPCCSWDRKTGFKGWQTTPNRKAMQQPVNYKQPNFPRNHHGGRSHLS